MAPRRPLVADAVNGGLAELPRGDTLDAETNDPLLTLVARLSTAVQFLGIDPADLPPDPAVLDTFT